MEIVKLAEEISPYGNECVRCDSQCASACSTKCYVNICPGVLCIVYGNK